MSETSLVIYCEFNSRKVRDAAMSFITKGKGPDFEDEVEEMLRQLFLALEDVQYPDTILKNGKIGMFVIYDVLLVSNDHYEDDEARQILDKFATAGAVQVYAYVYDDEEYEVYWNIENGQIKEIYTPEENGTIDHILFDLDDKKRLAKVIEFYEAGKLSPESSQNTR